MTRATATPATPEPEQAQARYVLGAAPDERLLLPDNLAACPDRVRALNDEAVRALDASRLAGQQLRAAQTGLKRAEAVDQAADRAADAVGAPLPKMRAVDGAAEALELAQRRHEASKENSRASMLALLHGIVLPRCQCGRPIKTRGDRLCIQCREAAERDALPPWMQRAASATTRHDAAPAPRSTRAGVRHDASSTSSTIDTT
jgi:hypothetical protein